jgi:hypothetical protein
MKTFIRFALAISAVAICWGLAWLAGYDFNERNPVVAYWGFLSLVAGFGVFTSFKVFK